MTSEEEPGDPPFQFVTRGGFEIAYRVFGAQDGKPLLMVHGLAASGRQFEADARWFAARGFRVIIPDLRGHGRSTGPRPVAQDDYARADLVADLIAILDQEHIASVNWVGNSLGGILALEAMLTSPDRLNTVIMFGTAFRLDIPPFVVKALAATYRAIGVQALATIGAPMTTRYREPQKLIDSMLREVQAEPMLAVGANEARYDLRAAARSFPRPILVIESSDDLAVNNANRTLLPRLLELPHMHLAKLKSAGHVANLDQPEMMREMIWRFVSRDLA
ncbi:MAG: alpha/beta hydrolase [Hyphomicrobiaceae bacterium]|nr:alpha/beta hydrolase [Hyphomicrobiaceae bacterium]MCC0024002.1 alpha/beta hydrolase [Hyphomicrobiaceae bacterium]